MAAGQGVRVKVLHVIDSGGLYGAEKVMLNLVSEQMKLGLQPEIASIGVKHISEKPLEREAKEMGIPVSVFRMRPGPNLLGALRIRNHALRNNFELLHSHGYKGNILLGIMPRWLRRLPLLATIHGYTSTGGLTKMRFNEWVDRVVFPRLDQVVLVSEKMRSHPKLNHGMQSNFRVIQNGISPLDSAGEAPTDPQYRQVVDFCKHGFIIGAIGRLSHEKAFDQLIEAFGIIAQQSKETRLLILGEGRMREELEAKIRNLALEERILMPGYVKDAAHFMKNFDIFVLSSITEGLPVTLLEAMQAGVPVVSTKAGGIVNVVTHGKTGLLVEHSDPPALAEAMRHLYHDSPQRQMLAENAKQKVHETYSSHRMALDYQELYSEILRKRGSKSGKMRQRISE